MDKKFMTIPEAALHLGKSAQTIRRMIKAGTLPAQRIKTPQGFNYVVEREGLHVEKPMLSESPIQNEVFTEQVEEKEVLGNQSDFLGNQSEVEEHKDAEKIPIDKNSVFFEVFWVKHHEERMALIHILEKLQAELNIEKSRPKGLFSHLMDWWKGH